MEKPRSSMAMKSSIRRMLQAPTKLGYLQLRKYNKLLLKPIELEALHKRTQTHTIQPPKSK